MSDEIRDRARKLFRAPFKYVSGYIWDDDGEMLADNHVGFDAPGATLRVRGWGRLGYIAKSPKEAEALQDAYGELIAEALTSHFRRGNAVLVPADKLKELQDERDRLLVESSDMRERYRDERLKASHAAHEFGEKFPQLVRLLAAVLPFACVSDDSLTVGQHLVAEKAIDEAAAFLSEIQKT